MTKRVTYDVVEAAALKARRSGHDFKLFFNYQGMLHLFHNGDLVLVDGPRDYAVALAKVQSLVWQTAPVLPKETDVEPITEKHVRRGRPEPKPTTKKKGKTRAKGK